MNLLVVMIGGSLGAVARVAMDSWVQHRWGPRWPVGTFLINVIGSGVLGVVTGLALAHGLDPHLRLLLGTGFCGGYTTFSTASFEVARLGEDGRGRVAGLYTAGTLAATLLAALAGLAASGGLR